LAGYIGEVGIERRSAEAASLTVHFAGVSVRSQAACVMTESSTVSS